MKTLLLTCHKNMIHRLLSHLLVLLNWNAINLTNFSPFIHQQLQWSAKVKLKRTDTASWHETVDGLGLLPRRLSYTTNRSRKVSSALTMSLGEYKTFPFSLRSRNNSRNRCVNLSPRYYMIYSYFISQILASLFQAIKRYLGTCEAITALWSP